MPLILPLSIRESIPADVAGDAMVQEFLQACYRTSTQEKPSDPNDWTPEESNAWVAGNWIEFSRLRGYTEAQIADFQDYMRLAMAVAARYSENDAAYLAGLVEGYFTQPRNPMRGQIWRDRVSEVRILAVAERWIMVRRGGHDPFCVPQVDLCSETAWRFVADPVKRNRAGA